MGLLEFIGREDRETVYIKTIEWIINLPNFILSNKSKNEFISKLFNAKFLHSDHFKTSFDKEKECLLIETSFQNFKLTGLKSYVSSTKSYIEFINNKGRLGVIYDFDSWENQPADAVYVISLDKIANALNQLQAKDTKSQYFIDDFIESIEKRIKNHTI